MNIKNKVVIITGASSGIGEATAIYFGSKQAKLVIAARSIDKLNALSNKMKTDGVEVLAIKTDVSQEEDCRNLIEQAIKHFGQIDVLINNAGISMRALFINLDLNVVRNVMGVNFWGTVYCTKFALPHLLKTQGTVAGISSIAGYIGLPARTAYSASKFAMHGFLEALRTENLENNLHVLIACPGFTSSNIRNSALKADGSMQGGSPRKEEEMMQPEEVAKELLTAIQHRKNKIILTREGRTAVLFKKLFPRIIRKLVFSKMKDEDDSPLK
ncbi:MAG: SDR family oxidoreductase [Vicingaceae bacterium]